MEVRRVRLVSEQISLAEEAMLTNSKNNSRPLSSSLLMLVAMASTQLGAVLAKQLFDGLGQAGALSLSYGFAAVVLVLWRRPKLNDYPHRVKVIAIAMGLVLAMMMLCLYGAIARIPLGIATALQFSGPLTLSAVRSCQRLDLVWIALAATGITLLSPFGNAKIDPLGAGLALAAGLLLATYIAIADRISGLFREGEGTAIATSTSALVLAPLGLNVGPILIDVPQLLALGLGVAILSTVVPLTLDAMILQRTSAKTFGLLLSLEPAVAALLGLVFLGEHLIPRAIVGIALVILAAAGHSRFQQTC